MNKANLIFMFGEDSFSLQEELRRWKSAFMQKHGDMNLEELDGSQVSPSHLSSSITALPFLGEKRLVLLKNFLQEQKAEAKKDLIPVLEQLPESTVLVIAENQEPDKRSALTKFLNKNATLKAFNIAKGQQLTQWIVQTTQKAGGNIDQRSAQYFANAVGEKPWQLKQEIEKLSLFAGQKSITPEMIDELVTGSLEQSIFTFTDQLAHRNTKAALKTLRKLSEDNEAPYLFAMIARQFRIMLETKALAEEGLPPQAIASKMKLHPFVVQKTLSTCRNFTHAQLKEKLRALLEIDRRLKTGLLHLRTREEDQYLLALERVVLSS